MTNSRHDDELRDELAHVARLYARLDAEEADLRGLAERAAADRSWTYGHAVVDEAQELSEMDWRVLMRRCPTRSMTIVGDLTSRRRAGRSRAFRTL